MATFPVTVREHDVRVEIPDQVYPLAAIHGTAVIFIEKAYIRIDRLSANRSAMILRPKLSATQEELQALGGSVLNELLHQALRVEVGGKTDKLRELVLGKAIMSAETQYDTGVAFAEADDPLGIARPWEDKYLGGETGGAK